MVDIIFKAPTIEEIIEGFKEMTFVLDPHDVLTVDIAQEPFASFFKTYPLADKVLKIRLPLAKHCNPAGFKRYKSNKMHVVVIPSVPPNCTQ